MTNPEAAHEQFVIDGEAVVLDRGGVSDVDALHSRKYDKRTQFYVPSTCLLARAKIIAA